MPDRVRLTPPAAGGRIRLTPTPGVGYTTKTLPLGDPLEGATDKERAFYEANYSGLTLAELLDRLRTAEWNAAERKRQLDAHIAGARYTRSSDAIALARVSSLVDVRRKTVRMHDLRCALGLVPWEEQ